MILKTVTKEIEASLVKKEDNGEDGCIELHVGHDAFDIEVDDEDLLLLRKVELDKPENGILEVSFNINLNLNLKSLNRTFKDLKFKTSRTLYKSESCHEIRDEKFFQDMKEIVDDEMTELECSDEFQSRFEEDRSGEDYTKEEALIALEIYNRLKDMDKSLWNGMIKMHYLDNNRLKRTIGSVRFKLDHFIHFETNGERGKDNWEKVFEDVWNEAHEK